LARKSETVEDLMSEIRSPYRPPRDGAKKGTKSMILTPELIGFAIISILLICIAAFGTRLK